MDIQRKPRHMSLYMRKIFRIDEPPDLPNIVFVGIFAAFITCSETSP